MTSSAANLSGQGLTGRALAAGLAIGVLMCLTNMYFGLQTGWITMGSLQSAILGFGIFKALQGFGLGRHFTIAENVIVQVRNVVAPQVLHKSHDLAPVLHTASDVQHC